MTSASAVRLPPLRQFLSAAEMGRLGEVLRAVAQDRTEHPSAVLAIRLLPFTSHLAGSSGDVVKIKERRRA